MRAPAHLLLRIIRGSSSSSLTCQRSLICSSRRVLLLSRPSCGPIHSSISPFGAKITIMAMTSQVHHANASRTASEFQELPAMEISSNTDTATAIPRVAALLGKRNRADDGAEPDDSGSSRPRSPSWTPTADGRGLRRDFKFKTFKTTWNPHLLGRGWRSMHKANHRLRAEAQAFMNTVAQKCAEERHHPQWTNLYNRVTITWTTHRPLGLSHKDLTMAEYCDETAQGYGEEIPEDK